MMMPRQCYKCVYNAPQILVQIRPFESKIMTGWLIIAGVVLVILYLVLFGSNAIATFSINNQDIKVKKGSFSPAFLNEAERVLKGAKGVVKVEPEHNYMVLKFHGQFSDQQRQAMTNIFPQENYRSVCSAFKQFR